jgi:hypothetical protein
MATNKRKDSAALFELIDKSTLKVPKNATGSLKIPSWWSSKGNPAVKSTVPAALPVTEKPAAATGSTPPRPTVSTPAEAAPRPTLTPAKAPVYAPPPGVVSRPSRASYVPGTNIPIWAAVIGGLAAAIIIVGAIWVATHQTPAPATTTPDGTLVGPGPVAPHGITPLHPENGIAGPRQGHVYGSQPNRNPQLFYLVIAHYPKDDVARGAAQFLAAYGVDVCIESSKGYFWLISYNGFPTMSSAEAQAFQRKVIEIGKEHKDGKRKVSVFNSAYFSHVVSGE